MFSTDFHVRWTNMNNIAATCAMKYFLTHPAQATTYCFNENIRCIIVTWKETLIKIQCTFSQSTQYWLFLNRSEIVLLACWCIPRGSVQPEDMAVKKGASIGLPLYPVPNNPDQNQPVPKYFVHTVNNMINSPLPCQLALPNWSSSRVLAYCSDDAQFV